MGNGAVKDYTREQCPICGHRGWCGRRDDGLVLCKRPPEPREIQGFTYMGMATDQTTGMYVEAGMEHKHATGRKPPPSRRSSSPSSPRQLLSPDDIAALQRSFVAGLTDELRVALASTLHLPPAVLSNLDIGWCGERRWWNSESQQYEGPPGCWTFPECDARGRMIGLGLRWPTGRQGQWSGGKRGLILPKGWENWQDWRDVVLCAEGPSDVLAASMLGIPCVGRPNNCGGADLIAQAFKQRRLILLGENDRKLDGNWPGRTGAEAVARKLEASWERAVPIAYPPEPLKDLRDWITQLMARAGGADASNKSELRSSLLAVLAPPTVLLQISPTGRRGNKHVVRAFAWNADPTAGPLYLDRVDLQDARSRQRFAKRVVELDPRADERAIEGQLMNFHAPQGEAARSIGHKGTEVEEAGAARPLLLKASAPHKPGAPSAQRPEIRGNDRQLRDVREDAIAALLAANLPPRLFMRAGLLSRIVSDTGDMHQTAPRIESLDAHALRGELSDSADWVVIHRTQGRSCTVADAPPLEVARDILARPTLPFPLLTGVITCPTFVEDGRLVVAPGYDATSGLWHHATVQGLGTVPQRPTADQVSAAVAEVMDILSDFPFADPSSRANAVALFLLPFVRRLFVGTTPLFAIDAPAPGTGKDLLAKALMLPGLGYVVGVTTAPKDADEWRKKLTAALMAGNAAIVFGNVTRKLDNEHLAAVLTDLTWRDRLLGLTQEVSLPNKGLWVVTANNLVLSKELARRVVWVRLDAKQEAPEQRAGFRYDDLLGHIGEHRTALVAAALTMVFAWIAAGRPVGRQVMGSFEPFARTIGGILDVVGITGFLGNASELRRDADVETAEWRRFILAWWSHFGDAWVGAAELQSLLWSEDRRRTDQLASVLTSETERGIATQLGHRLSSKRDNVIAGFRLVADPEHGTHKRLAYRLVPVHPEGSMDSGCSPASVSGGPPTAKSRADMEIATTGDSRRVEGQAFPDTHSDALIAAGGAENSPPYALAPIRESPEVSQQTQTACDSEVITEDSSGDLGETRSGELNTAGSEHDIGDALAWQPSGEPANCEGPRRRGCDDGVESDSEVQGMTSVPDGWTAAAWRERLLHLAEMCEGQHPGRAAALRKSAMGTGSN